MVVRPRNATIISHACDARSILSRAAPDVLPPAGATDGAQCAPPDAPQPPESWSLLPLHIPGDSLAQLSASLAPLAPNLRLSTHDVLAGLVWALRCTLAGVDPPGGQCSGRFIVALDLSANGLPPGVLPADFTGNCAAALSVSAKAGGLDDAAGRHLLAVAHAAAAVRTAVAAYRSEPLNAVRHLLACGERIAGPAAPGSWRQGGAGAMPLVGYATSCLRVPTAALDCGSGPPVALHYSTLPLRSTSGLQFASLAPGPHGDGALVLLAASDAHARMLTSSSGPAAELLRAAVPAARLLM